MSLNAGDGCEKQTAHQETVIDPMPPQAKGFRPDTIVADTVVVDRQRQIQRDVQEGDDHQKKDRMIVENFGHQRTPIGKEEGQNEERAEDRSDIHDQQHNEHDQKDVAIAGGHYLCGIEAHDWTAFERLEQAEATSSSASRVARERVSDQQTCSLSSNANSHKCRQHSKSIFISYCVFGIHTDDKPSPSSRRIPTGSHCSAQWAGARRSGVMPSASQGQQMSTIL